MALNAFKWQQIQTNKTVQPVIHGMKILFRRYIDETSIRRLKMEKSRTDDREILPCYLLEGGDMQAFEAEQLGESQAETENTSAQENSE